MSKPIPIKRIAEIVTLLIAPLLMGFTDSGSEKDDIISHAVGSTPQIIEPTNFPYYNDLELTNNTEKPYGKQKEWRFGDAWKLVQGNSVSPSWHLEFSKTGSGLGRSAEGTAQLDAVISIPDTATYPTISFWQQLHLEKTNQSVVLEARVFDVDALTEAASGPEVDRVDDTGWTVLRRLTESDNTDAYSQLTVDLSAYVGQSLQFRLRTVERSEKAEVATGVTLSTGGSDGDTVPVNQSGKKAQEKSKHTQREKVQQQARGPIGKGKPTQTPAVNGNKQSTPYLLWRVDDIAIGERDSDHDGIGDIFEIRVGADPNDPQSVPADSNHDGIPDVLNSLTGTWDGPCRYVGGGEFLRESLTVTELRIKRNYQSSAFADCHVGWNSVSKVYDYALKDMVYESESLDAKLNLEMERVAVTPSTADVAEALNRTCDKQDFVAGEKNEAGGVSCSGGVVYPQEGVMHYDIIRQRGKTLWLGDQRDVTDPTLRSTRFDSTTAFQKAESIK